MTFPRASIMLVVHDIGIKIAEEKFGACNGKLQEQEGPQEAENRHCLLVFLIYGRKRQRLLDFTK